MVQLTKIRNRIRTVKVEFADDDLDPITVTYRPLNRDIVQAMKPKRAERAENDAVEVLATDLAAQIESWDVFDGDTPVPPTVEVLATFPVFILTSILTAIQEHQAPPTKASAS